LKANKNGINIFEAPIKILRTEVFRDGWQPEAQKFSYA